MKTLKVLAAATILAASSAASADWFDNDGYYNGYGNGYGYGDGRG